MRSRSLAANNPSSERVFKSLPEWLSWHESLHVSEIELGLERCRRVAERMGLGAPAKTVVTVAGTNGKGSSVAILDSILREAGYSVGTYTSPHLLAYNERIRIGGQPASDEAICDAFERIEYSRGTIPLTYFEFGTLAALAMFSDAALDVAILEVGLGGRLDAVNIVDPDVSLIATIGIDHIEFLGDTRESISLEKAGIMRANTPAVCSDADVPRAMKDFARSLPTNLDIPGDGFRFAPESDTTWSWWSDNDIKADLPRPNLEGDYQLRNAAGVLMVLEHLREKLPVSPRDIVTGLETIRLTGRFQRFPGDVETIVDVAHNAQATAAFVRTLAAAPCPGRTHVLLGMLRVKDRTGVIQALRSVADTWHLATITGRRGAKSSELYDALKKVVGKSATAELYDSVGAGYEGVLAGAIPGDRIVALGSFLVVSEVLGCLDLCSSFVLNDIDRWEFDGSTTETKGRRCRSTCCACRCIYPDTSR